MKGCHSFGNVFFVVSNVCEYCWGLSVAASFAPAGNSDDLADSLDSRQEWSTRVSVASAGVYPLTLEVSAGSQHGVLFEVLTRVKR